MNDIAVRRALQAIAAKDGVTVEQARAEMQKAIDEGMASTDPQAQALWQAVPRRGDKPTVEEYITFVAQQVKQGE